MITEINERESPAMPETPGYTWRALERSDGAALNRLLLEVEAADHNGYVDTMEERERDWKDPNSNYRTDTLAAFTPEGQMVAFGWVITPQIAEAEWLGYLWWEIHPHHRDRGLAAAVLDWTFARGAQILAGKPGNLPCSLQSGTRAELHYRIRAMEDAGFNPVRSNYRMLRDLRQPTPDVRLPDGYQLETWVPERDAETLAASNEAFTDHWGFVPMTLERWQMLFSNHPEFHPELSYQALVKGQQGPGQVAGFTICKIRHEENRSDGLNKGWIIELAVRRSHRKQGIATALLCACMQAFKDMGLEYAVLGVDSENRTGAVRLYERLGFKPIHRSFIYSRKVTQRECDPSIVVKEK